MNILDYKDKNAAFKCVRSTGKDFYADHYQHEVGGVVTEPDTAPAEHGLCGRGLHVSPTLRQAIACSYQAQNARQCYPWRFFRVHVAAPNVVRVGDNKMRVRSYRVEQEYTLEDIFGAEFYKRIEDGRADRDSWKAIPWFKPARDITAEDIAPLLAEWRDALDPWLAKRGINRDVPRKAIIITDRAAAGAGVVADAATVAADYAAAAAADYAARDAAAGAASTAVDAAADYAAAIAAAAVADDASLWPPSWHLHLRPRYVLWRAWLWRALGIKVPNPWEPLVKMYRLGVAPVGYRVVDGEAVFVVCAP